MPDPNKPLVEVEEKRAYPFEITVDADIGHRGVFSVKRRFGDVDTSAPINYVKLPRLQAFVSAYPGEHQFRFKAIDYEPEADLPFEELNDEAALVTSAIVRGMHRIEIGFTEDESTSLSLLLRYTSQGQEDNPHLFGVSEILARDKSSNIEAIIEAYTDLVTFERKD